MGKKVIIIGIDALDSVTLSNLKDSLPNFAKLMEISKNIKFDGVFPPDSPTSWASIYTGLNPAKHGIILFVDPLRRVSTMINKDVDDTNIRGLTFWDIASKKGKKVCIIPHLLGYPVWPVNGIMIGRSGVNPDVDFYPKSLADRFNFSQFKWDLKLFPGRAKEKYIETAKKQIKRELEFAVEIYNSDKWDLFFISFGELDPIQYSFWNYYDELDPTYPKRTNQFKETIPEFYRIYDEIIGGFLSKIDSDTLLIVVSDHGIGSRPVKLVNINEILKELGYLKIKGELEKNTFKNKAKGKIKNICLNTIDKFDLGNIAAKGLKIVPKGKEWIISNASINWEISKAYLTDQSGIKNYPYGGIIIREKNGNYQYEEIRDRIIETLSQLRDPNTNEKIVRWVVKRENLYKGELFGRYPDILFELEKNYAAGSEINNGIFGKSSTHNLAPGCHKQHHATFLISDQNFKEGVNVEMILMDVSPTILHLLNIDWRNYNFDGKSIFE